MSRKCEIQWVDASGNPTPDGNEAVCIAVSTIVRLSTGEETVRRYPCCAEHAKQLTESAANSSREPDRVSNNIASLWTREEI